MIAPAKPDGETAVPKSIRRKGRRLSSEERAAEASECSRRSIYRRATNNPCVFVVLLFPLYVLYGWEIRKFGRFVLTRGLGEFRMAADARAAGEQALLSFELNHEKV